MPKLSPAIRIQEVLWCNNGITATLLLNIFGRISFSLFLVHGFMTGIYGHTSITHPFYCVSCFTALHITDYDKKCHAQNILLLNTVNLILVNSKYCSIIPENMTTYEVVSECSQTVIVVLPKTYRITPPYNTVLWTCIVLHICFFDFVFCFVCDGWQNRSTCLHQVLRETR
jgi:hypothetical protein